MRECAHALGYVEQLRTPKVAESLLTLRVYREDITFWEEYEIEMEHLVHKFLKHTYKMPAVEYHQLEEYVRLKLPHLKWTPQELSQALILISKIRGQLRPLRHGGFDLNEFNFGFVRNSVPTELRPFVLNSWHKMIDKKEVTHEILTDLWRIAAINSVHEGRNIPLYQLEAIEKYLKEGDVQNITKSVEESVPS